MQGKNAGIKKERTHNCTLLEALAAYIGIQRNTPQMRGATSYIVSYIGKVPVSK